jgi:hypothetical protein
VTENNRSSGSDPIGDFQRWLVRSSAKNLGREIKGQVRRTFGGGADGGDVWGVATTEPPPNAGEAPECAWCPVCRAARRFRESGPGLASQVAGAGDALLSVAQDTIAAFEATLSARPSSPVRKSPAGTGWPGQPDDRRPTDAGAAPARPASAPGGPAAGGPAAGGPAPGEPAPGEPASGGPASGRPAPSEPAPGAPASGHGGPAGEGHKAPDDPDHRP